MIERESFPTGKRLKPTMRNKPEKGMLVKDYRRIQSNKRNSHVRLRQCSNNIWIRKT